MKHYILDIQEIVNRVQVVLNQSNEYFTDSILGLIKEVVYAVLMNTDENEEMIYAVNLVEKFYNEETANEILNIIYQYSYSLINYSAPHLLHIQNESIMGIEILNENLYFRLRITTDGREVNYNNL